MDIYCIVYIFKIQNLGINFRIVILVVVFIAVYKAVCFFFYEVI